jgi:hypothetical protein
MLKFNIDVTPISTPAVSNDGSSSDVDVVDSNDTSNLI